jgi:Zn-dependent M16 (insulinase) family peptidase
MKTTLKAGQILDSGFEILEIAGLEELKAAGVWARHQKSGAEVFHVLNDDPENLFAFTFATPPEDSAGAPHVLEHSVLCGSANYPLKDAFLVLAQGSLQTFLNALTFPDKTLYPASSVNERDYFNLMSVYGDAVFRPLLSEWTFMQEGRRFVFAPGEGEGRLAITGVVYNEMKGAYSSQDTYAGLWSVRSVLPDTPYAFESGGDPEAIPDLTWEGLKEFHRRRYSPANCRIFLAGNIPTEKQLAFLDERFLSSLPPGEAAPPLPRAAGWDAPREFRVPCPAPPQKAAVFLSWLCPEAGEGNAAESLALAALTETLLGHDGSPLTRLLIESGLGEDLAPSTGLEGELREQVFTVGLRGVDLAANPGIEKRIEALILDELARLVREGIPREEIEAALLAMEFSNREVRRSGGPYSLVWLRKSLRGWLHGEKPWERLLFVPPFGELKRRLGEAPGYAPYFESLIQRYFLDNPHRALVVVEPRGDYLEKQEAELAERLRRTEAALTGEERRAIEEKAAALERLQGEGEDPAALATIPHLSRGDLSPKVEPVPRELTDAGGIPVLAHDLFTNGISYGDFALPLDLLESGDYPWLPLFSRSVVSLGLPGMDYAGVSSLLARRVGGFYAILRTGSALSGPSPAALSGAALDLAGRDWLIFRLKALDEKIGPALDLALRLITQADFSDLRRLRDLVMEMKNDLDSSLAPSGHSYASGRAGRRFSRARAVEEVWNGLGQIEFAHTLAGLDTAEISRRLAGLRDRLLQGGMILSLTGSSAALGKAAGIIRRDWPRFGPPKPRNPALREAAPFLALGGNFPASAGGAEVFASPSLQVGFAALTLPAASLARPAEHAAEIVLAHQLSTGALWEDIRMKGGAYGAFAHPDGIEETFSLSTYRDPKPLRSAGAFPAILEAASGALPDGETLEKAVIGSYAGETRPRTNAERGFADFLRFLSGIDQRHREEKLRALIQVSPQDLAAAAARLSASRAASSPVIIAGTAEAEKAAAQLGAVLRELPV